MKKLSEIINRDHPNFEELQKFCIYTLLAGELTGAIIGIGGYILLKGW